MYYLEVHHNDTLIIDEILRSFSPIRMNIISTRYTIQSELDYGIYLAKTIEDDTVIICVLNEILINIHQTILNTYLKTFIVKIFEIENMKKWEYNPLTSNFYYYVC